MAAPQQSPQRANRRLLWQLGIAAVAMFGFGYLLVPLYDVFCELVGIERGAQLEAVTQTVAEAPDPDRTVTVEFLLSVNSGRWDFAIQQRRMQVHPGKFYTVTVIVTNLADQPVTGQAIFSTAPTTAGGYVRKTECFCFSPQPFAANETRELPIRFMLDPALPGNIGTVTFAYTMYQLVQPTARQPS